MAAPWRQNSSFYQKYLFHMLSVYNSRPEMRVYLELILSLLAIIVLGVFAIRPTLTTIATLNAEMGQKQELVATLDKKINDLSTAQQALQVNQSTLSLLDTSVPLSPSVEDYIKQLEALAIADEIIIESIKLTKVALVGNPIAPTTPTTVETNGETSVGPIPLPAGASPVVISATVSGQYRNLMTFLGNVENHRRPISIDSINSTLSEENSVFKITFTSEGRIPYFYIQQQQEQEEEMEEIPSE